MGASYSTTDYSYGLRFTLFKKHYCPNCHEKLKRKKWINIWRRKTIKRQYVGATVNKVANKRFLFYCSNCKKLYTPDEVFYYEKLIMDTKS